MEIGDTVKIKDEHNDHIKLYLLKQRNAQAMMRLGAFDAEQAKKEIFEFIAAQYPDLCNFNIAVDEKNMTFLVTGKKH